MEDGSRTPITPSVDADEMEAIIRDFFGTHTPEDSSASTNKTLAADSVEGSTTKVKKAKKNKDKTSGTLASFAAHSYTR